tara:strand:+ start:7804 stop:8346 length:543 start_codon:yes stop_codon:yes gene_type:complete
LNKLSCKEYFTDAVDEELFLTDTLIKSVSTPIFGRINFCWGFLSLYVKFFCSTVPSKIVMLLKDAMLLITGTVISSKIQNAPPVPPNDAEDVATVPLRRVRDAGLGVMLVVSTKNDIDEVAAFLDLGVYPIFLARAITFSLKVAVSIKTSFATMLALYEVMYVLYASTSKIDDRLEPSKS